MNQEPKEKLISLAEATKHCKYTQEYLSYRARIGKLKSVKIGRGWMTTRRWLDEYVGKVEEYKQKIILRKNLVEAPEIETVAISVKTNNEKKENQTQKTGVIVEVVGADNEEKIPQIKSIPTKEDIEQIIADSKTYGLAGFLQGSGAKMAGSLILLLFLSGVLFSNAQLTKLIGDSGAYDSALAVAKNSASWVYNLGLQLLNLPQKWFAGANNVIVVGTGVSDNDVNDIKNELKNIKNGNAIAQSGTVNSKSENIIQVQSTREVVKEVIKVNNDELTGVYSLMNKMSGDIARLQNIANNLGNTSTVPSGGVSLGNLLYASGSGVQSNGSGSFGSLDTSGSLQVYGTGTIIGNLTARGGLTVGVYALPITDGVAGDVLTTNGAGAVTWQAGGGGVPATTDTWNFPAINLSDATNQIVLASGAVNNGTITMAALGAPQVWTLPNNSGVLALTSDLSAYVPYTGATATVDLGVHDLVVDNNSLFVDSANHRVGIGAAIPASKLHVYTTTNGDGIEVDGNTNVGYSLATSGVIKAYIGVPTAAGSWIANSVAGDLAIRSEGKNILFSTDSGTTANMYIKNGGNVGIGTTSPGTKLTIDENGSSSDGLTIQNMASGGTFTLSDSTIDTSRPTGLYLMFSNSSKDINFQNGKVFFKGDGNVGIGTTTPTGLLEISRAGDSAFTGTTKGHLVLTAAGDDANKYTNIDFRGSGDNYTQGKPVGRIGTQATPTGSYLFFGTSNNYNLGITNTAVAIDPSGNVGIGTTTPGSKLDVSDTNKSFNGRGNLNVYTTDAYNIDLGGQIGLGGMNGSAGIVDPYVFAVIKGAKNSITIGNLAGYLAMGTADGGGTINEWMRITSDGKVGIGTTTPNYKLTVDNADGNYFASALLSGQIGTPGNWVGQLFGFSGTTYQKGALIFESKDAYGRGKMHIALNNGADTTNASISNAIMTVDSGGNVGIGTTAPDRALEINSATGINLRLTYNDSDGSATNYADLLTSNTGDLTVSASGGNVILGGVGAVNNENLNFDFETVANTIGLSSSTGAATVDATAFGLRVGKLEVNGAYTLPTTDGTANQVLKTDGTGVVSWGVGTQATTDTWTFSTVNMTERLSVTGSADFAYTTISDETQGYQVDGLPVITNKGASGSENLFLGQAGNFSITGTNNLFSGYQAGLANLAGSNNFLAGYQAGLVNFSGSDNILIGYQVGLSTITANNNIFMGYKSGYSNGVMAGVSSSNNIMLGYMAGYSFDSSSASGDNFFAGYQAGYGVNGSSGKRNTFIGEQAGYANSTGADNSFVGYNSGYTNSTGSNNIYTGYQSGYTGTTGSNKILQGYQAGYSETTGSNNIYQGYQAGYYFDTANASGDNFFAGYQAGYGVSGSSTGTRNTFIGEQAGYGSTTGTDNMFVGYNSGYRNTTGSNNVYTGYQSGYVSTTGSSNIFQGYRAGYSGTTGSNNIYQGYQTGYYETTGGNNIYLGYQAGKNFNTANASSDNFFAGYQAGYGRMGPSGNGESSGINNLFIGYQAGYVDWEGSNNIYLGYQAGYSATGDNNIFLGASTGFTNTTGNQNLFLGSNAGYTNSTGSGNVFLGYQAGYYETESNKLFIDNTQRASEADARTKALVYGIFAAATSDQYFTVNGNITAAGTIQSGSSIILDGTGATGSITETHGSISMGGTGGTFNENFVMDFEAAADAITMSSTTGAATMDFGSFKLNTTGAASFGQIYNTALTAARIPFATTGGQLTDSANLTFDGTTVTISGDTQLTIASAGISGLGGDLVFGPGAARTIKVNQADVNHSGDNLIMIGGRAGNSFDSDYNGGSVYIYGGLKTNSGTNGNVVLVHTGAAQQGNVGIANISPGALLDLGTAGSIAGIMRFEGATSGYAALQATAAAGNVTLTLPATTGTLAINPMTSAGDIVYGGASGVPTRLAAGTTGQILRTNTGAAPSWSTATFPSTAATAGAYLRADGTNWITSTLVLPNSGTAYKLAAYTAANTLTELASVGSTGQILQANTGAIPSWSTATYPTTTTANQILYSTSANVVGAGTGLTFDGTTLTVLTTGGAQEKLSYDASNYASFTVNASGDLNFAATTTTSGGDLVFTPGTTGNPQLLSDSGTIVFGGNGLTNNENLTFDFETTADTVAIASTTGVGNITWTGSITMGGSTTGTLVTRVKNGAPDEADANGSIVINSGASPGIYYRYGDAWHYAGNTGGFQIPNNEIVDPLSSEQIKEGDFVLGMVNETYEDNALHGIWVKWNSIKGQMIEDLKKEFLGEDVDIKDNGTAGDGKVSDVKSITFADILKNAITSFGIEIKDGIVTIKDLAVSSFTAKNAKIDKIEMVDQVTGIVYCTFIQNGEWVKIPSACKDAGNFAPEPKEEPPAENPPEEDPMEPPAENPPPENPPAENPPVEEPPAENPPEENPPPENLPSDGVVDQPGENTEIPAENPPASNDNGASAAPNEEARE